ncbi:xylulokinase [Paenibacillus flagellatus]|uniref:Xylulose kinase n=1 Tax=Paenibacillus flagellatus TaxID=2211139 RepID=A0A2V5KVI1_9BACL|nr:xylulokinase [Paenibacillus flagellatus]PYI53576.1 xylulokinase [Paenibacillus flagellatus]
MSYVIGIDLGTSAVKALLVDRDGRVRGEASESYPLISEKPGYNEQEPERWVEGTVSALRTLVRDSGVEPAAVEGVSFSGQMHGLVLLDAERNVLRNAILWNDTRTTEQCREIESALGGRLLDIAKNRALEGFTLPKLLWVKRHEPETFAKADVFLLPKDYVRYRLTGRIASEYSDAAGTLLLDVAARRWSADIAAAFGLPESLLPPLVAPHADVGTLLPDVADATGLPSTVRVFAGGADNACGAIGAGILSEGETLCSIGTSGVVLSYVGRGDVDYGGRLHFFNHGEADAYYAMGVTLAAGYSLQWFKDAFAPHVPFEALLRGLDETPPGAGGLLFTPYIVGERTPHPDATIRGSFVGMDASHRLAHFTRAVVEGITFSLKESLDILRGAGHDIRSLVSIGGGAKNEHWLQMQADIFGADIHKLESEQGPAMGAAMLAAYGCGWFGSLAECAAVFIKRSRTFRPREEQRAAYDRLFRAYQSVYGHTRELNEALAAFRKPQAQA